MADEPEHYIVGDAAVEAIEQPPKRTSWFRRRNTRPRHITECENCGTALTGSWCSSCGQHAIDYRRSLWRIIIDAADAFLDWDTKFLRTTRTLLLKPWRLTNEFNAGHRVRYAHPLRLYLLASIAFFLLARLANMQGDSGPPRVEITPADREEMVQAISRLTAPETPLPLEQRAKLEALLEQIRTPAPGADPLERARAARAIGRLTRFGEKKKLTPNDSVRIGATLKRIDEAMAPPTPSPAPDVSPAPPAPPDGPAVPAASPRSNRRSIFQSDSDDPNKPRSATEQWFEDRVKEKIGEDGTKAQLFLATLRDNIPTMMLFCIPLFALVLKLLYVRQRRYYIEHLVYALHIHSFVYVATVVITLFAMASEQWLGGAREPFVVLLSLAVVVQVFLSVRRVYGQGWFFTTFKFILGAFIYLIVLVAALSVTAIVTFLLP